MIKNSFPSGWPLGSLVTETAAKKNSCHVKALPGWRGFTFSLGGLLHWRTS